MRNRCRNRCLAGLTLVELMVALCVVSVVMAAVATLAYAMGSANDASDDTSAKQAQVRCATLRIGELIRNSRLIISLIDNNLAIWKADTNNDGAINLSEVVYIGSNASKNYIRMTEFTSDNRTLHPYQVASVLTTWWNSYASSYCHTYLVPVCNNVTVTTDVAAPRAKSANITFNIQENGVTKTYQITATLRGWAGNALDSTGSYFWSNDDDELHPAGGYPIVGTPVAF